MLAIYYLLFVRPQQFRQQRVQLERQQFLDSLKLGDRVVTIAGICGTVVALRDKFVHLRIAPTMTITVTRDSIAGLSPAEVEMIEDIER